MQRANATGVTFAGFKQQSMLLARMFFFVESGKIRGPIYPPDRAPAGTSNKDFLREYVSNLLREAFKNLQPYVSMGFFTLLSPIFS
jgi:exportin-1